MVPLSYACTHTHTSSLCQGWLPVHCAVAVNHMTVLAEMSPPDGGYAEVISRDDAGEVCRFACVCVCVCVCVTYFLFAKVKSLDVTAV